MIKNVYSVYSRLIAFKKLISYGIILRRLKIEGGRMVVPVGGKTNQELIEIIKTKNGYRTVKHGGCRFVDLIGAHGWKE